MPSGQTVIRYNGITITNCVTEQFAQDAVYDDSGTDPLYHKFTIEVTGFISGIRPSGGGLHNSVDGPLTAVYAPPPTYPDPAYQEVAIRSALLEPRKEFQMVVGASATLNGGTQLLRVLPYPTATGPTPLPEWKDVSPGSPGPATGTPVAGDRGGYDLNNGPKCLSCSLTQITGNTIFRVRVRFEVCKLECDEHGQSLRNHKGVLSNRWSVADDIDENLMVTRKFQGVLRVTTANLNPHEFRTVVVPPLQQGFYRKSMVFNASEDGLKLAYTVIDRETVWAAPKPATKWYLNHKESTVGATGQTVGEATCQLWGDRNTDDQRILLTTAIAIVQSKLYLPGVETLPQEVTATTEYGTESHTVTVYMRVMRTLVLSNFVGMMHQTLGTGVSGANPFIATSPAAGYNPNQSRGSRPGDKIEVSGPITIATAWRAYLQTPCDEDHAIDLARNAIPEIAKPKDTEYSLSISPSSSIPDTPIGYINSEHQRFPYTYWDMQSLYDSTQNRVALPIARGITYGSRPTDATQAIVTLCPPTWKRIIRCTGTRVGKEPSMPDFPKTYTLSGGGSRRATMVGQAKISAHPPEKTLDGTNLYRVDIDVEYALTHEPRPSDRLPIGFQPWQNNAIGYGLPLTSFSVAPTTAGVS